MIDAGVNVLGHLNKNSLVNKEFPQHVYHVGGNDYHVDEG